MLTEQETEIGKQGGDVTGMTPIERVINHEQIVSGLYPLDAAVVTVETKAAHGDQTVSLLHRFNKPTLEAVKRRDSSIKRETKSIGSGEQSVTYNDSQANTAFYDGLIASVVLRAESGNTRELTADEAKEQLPFERKVKAVQELYRLNMEVVSGDEEDEFDFLLGGDADQIRVKQIIGDKEDPAFAFTHIFNQPTEQQRLRYQEQASELRTVGGAKQTRTRIIMNPSAGIALYDSLIARVEGAAIDGKSSEEASTGQLRASVDPVFKAEAIAVAIESFSSSLENL